MRARQRHFNAGSAGAAASYDARFLSLNNNDAVDSWTDRSANGRNATQSTSTKKPTFKTGITGGSPAISFDGGDGLVTSTYSATPSFAIICAFSASANGLVYERGTNYTVAGDHYLYTTTNDTAYAIGAGPFSATASAKNYSSNWGLGSTWRIVSHQIDGTSATHQLVVNGSSVSLTNVVSNDPGAGSYSLALNIGSRNNATSLGITGNLGAFHHFSPICNAEMRRRIEQSIAYSFKIACS
jgi:hypothetical protein